MRLRRPTLGLRWYFEHNDGHLMDKWDHYFDVYERHFGPFRGRKPKMLEIGVSHGGSLQMFRHYLGRGTTIVGIDVHERIVGLAEPGIVPEVGSQSDLDFLADVCRRHGPFDIILDDGSHWYRDQRASLHALWPHLVDGGVYLVEDVHTSYMARYEGGLGRDDTFIGETQRRVDDLHRYWLDDEGVEGEGPNDWTTSMTGIHVYDSIVVFDKGVHSAPVRRMTGRPAFETIYGFPADDMITDDHRAQLAALNTPPARVRRALRDPRAAWQRLAARLRSSE
ncbi:MAG: hypothetical protein CL424_19870 [Acidimicrobiaceae bacterium]|nr:hypothetical protein [Acidimicrobiaceae bacterium]